MRALRRRLCLLGAAGFCVIATAQPVRAQVADALSTYDGDDAIGYTAPLRQAIVAGLGGSLFTGAPFLEDQPFRARLSYRSIRAFVRDEDRSFVATAPLGSHRATPESGSSGIVFTTRQEKEVEAPTIFGAGDAVLFANKVNDQLDAVAILPGGLDLDAVGWTVPQLNLGWQGYEAVLRYASLSTGGSELGQLDLLGLGLRADVTRFIDPGLAIAFATSISYQSFDYADGLIDGDLWSFGLEAGRRIGFGHVYSGITFDRVDFGLDYVGPEGDPVRASERQSRARLTVGGGLEFPYVQLDAELHYNSIYSVAFGLSLGL